MKREELITLINDILQDDFSDSEKLKEIIVTVDKYVETVVDELHAFYGYSKRG